MGTIGVAHKDANVSNPIETDWHGDSPIEPKTHDLARAGA